MGALGHYVEAAGVPTTQISLVREHSERIRPPRALWVPFELGRPLGTPGDPEFQTGVVRAALALLEAPAGPMLEDYPLDVPSYTDGAEADAPWACPIPLAQPRGGASESSLAQAFQEELARLLPWYALAAERRGRTTVGLSGLEPRALGAFLAGLLEGPLPASGHADKPLGVLLKHAAEDLKALYGEAVTAQPGSDGRAPSAQEARHWFWNDTRAGSLLRVLADRLSEVEDPSVALVARLMLVPYDER